MGTAITSRLGPGGLAGDFFLENPQDAKALNAASDPSGFSTSPTAAKIAELSGLEDIEAEDYLDQLENARRTPGETRRTDVLFFAMLLAITTLWIAGAWVWLHRPH